VNNGSVLELEPFKSNKDKFNFWYVDEIIPLNRCQRSILGGTTSTRITCDDNQYRLNEHCAVDNKYVTRMINDDFRSSAGGWIHMSMVPRDGDSYRVFTKEGLALSFSDPGLFSHEFGHQFGDLRDEYVEEEKPFSGTREITQGNCYFGISKTEDECLQNTQWKEFIGNGCKEDGIIDCEHREDDLYNLEVGCFEGCLYTSAEIYRSTFNNIMRSHNRDPFGFGEWNEFLIQEKIDLIGINPPAAPRNVLQVQLNFDNEEISLMRAIKTEGYKHDSKEFSESYKARILDNNNKLVYSEDFKFVLEIRDEPLEEWFDRDGNQIIIPPTQSRIVTKTTIELILPHSKNDKVLEIYDPNNNLVFSYNIDKIPEAKSTRPYGSSSSQSGSLNRLLNNLKGLTGRFFRDLIDSF
jgi:hypothetical protein